MPQPIPFTSRSTADQVLAGIDLSRKRVLVTECDSPIGLETMKALSANGAVVIGVSRALHDAETACSAVGRSTPLGCDPTDPASVETAMESLQRLSDPLDVVIINAFESRRFADQIAQFVLVDRLAEFARHATGRIAIAGDDPSLMEPPAEKVVFDDPNNARIHDPLAFHGQSQVASALFSKELSRRLKSRGVMVNAFHSAAPGYRDPRDARPARRLVLSLLRLFARSAAQRAATPALLAASPLVAGITGEYWSDCQISRRTPLLSEAGLAKRLWDLSAQARASGLFPE